jgi:hypothetical protein
MGGCLMGVHLNMYLMSVYFMRMHSAGVYLVSVHVIAMHLMGMQFMGVYLTGVHLIGVLLTGVRLVGVYLTIDLYLISHGRACRGLLILTPERPVRPLEKLRMRPGRGAGFLISGI